MELAVSSVEGGGGLVNWRIVFSLSSWLRVVVEDGSEMLDVEGSEAGPTELIDRRLESFYGLVNERLDGKLLWEGIDEGIVDGMLLFDFVEDLEATLFSMSPTTLTVGSSSTIFSSVLTLLTILPTSNSLLTSCTALSLSLSLMPYWIRKALLMGSIQSHTPLCIF